MGMMFRYSLAQCNDWKLCHLDPHIHETVSPREITEDNPGHWHLRQWEGGEWTTKTRDGVLGKLMGEINKNYDRLYDEQGEHRTG